MNRRSLTWTLSIAACLSIPAAAACDDGPTATLHQTYHGSWLVGLGGDQGCYGSLIKAPTVAGDGVLFDRFFLRGDSAGREFRVQMATGPQLWWWGGITFEGEDGRLLEHFRVPTDKGFAEGTVPADAQTAVLWSCESGPSSASYASWRAPPK